MSPPLKQHERPQLKQLPKRHPAGRGYVTGEDAKRRILSGAIKVFSEDGYVGASTRRIATESGVNTPAIQYYFENKAGLHRACAEFVVETWRDDLNMQLEMAGVVLTNKDAERAHSALSELLVASLERSLSGQLSPAHSRFLHRIESEGRSPALTVLNEGLIAPMHKLTRGLSALAMGKSEDDAEVHLATFGLIRLLFTFGSVLRDPDQHRNAPGVEKASVSMVKEMFQRLVKATLGLH